MLVTQQQMKKRRLQDDRIYVKNEYMFETNQDVGVESIATSEGRKQAIKDTGFHRKRSHTVKCLSYTYHV